jgi:hypothetical protein
VQSVVREGFRRTRSAGKEPGGEKRLSSADFEGERVLMFYLLQVYALVIAIVLLPVFLLYTLTTLSRRAISAVENSLTACRQTCALPDFRYVLGNRTVLGGRPVLGALAT